MENLTPKILEAKMKHLADLHVRHPLTGKGIKLLGDFNAKSRHINPIHLPSSHLRCRYSSMRRKYDEMLVSTTVAAIAMLRCTMHVAPEKRSTCI